MDFRFANGKITILDKPIEEVFKNMRIAKTIRNSDPAEAVQQAVNWFFNEQDEYEEGEMVVCIRPKEDVEVAFIIDER